MKYVIFNIAVVFSLAAIIWDKPEDKSQITEKFQSLIDNVKSGFSRSNDFNEKNRKVLGSITKEFRKTPEGVSKVLLERPQTQKGESISDETRAQKIFRTSRKTEHSKKVKIKNSKTTNLAKPLNAKTQNTNVAVSQIPRKNKSHFVSPLSEKKQNKAKKLKPKQSIPISNDNRRRALLILSEEMEIVHTRLVYE